MKVIVPERFLFPKRKTASEYAVFFLKKLEKKRFACYIILIEFFVYPLNAEIFALEKKHLN